MTIREAQTEFIRSFNKLDDWFMQYELLLEIAGSTPLPAEDEKNGSTKIRGCQSNTWLVLKNDGERLFLSADSESLIIRGILGVFVMLLNEQRLEDAAEAELCFIEQTALKEQLSTDRFSTMNRVKELIRAYCKEHMKKEGKERNNV